MRRSKRPLRLIFILAVCQPTLFASAAPFTFQFSGVIDLVEDGLPISDQIAVGMPYSGIYQFDPEGVGNSSGLPTIGAYRFGSAGFMSVDIGSINISALDLVVSVENSTLIDSYRVGNDSTFAAQGSNWLEMKLSLKDTTHTAFNNTDLPLTAPDLDDFEFSKLFYLRHVDHRFPSITGTVDTLTMIPEPSSLVSLFAASVAILSLRGKRSARPVASD